MVTLIFHGLNGVRIMLIEFGYLLTEPKEQEYLYQVWLKNRRHRGYVLFMGILGIFLTILAGGDTPMRELTYLSELAILLLVIIHLVKLSVGLHC
ncbi:MAG: hypothetical protein RXS23_09845 [Metallosphaera yellowstonensis]